MNRKLLINIHLYLLSFFAPVLLVMGFSGGLYLLGIEGNIQEKVVYTAGASEINLSVESPKQEVERVLQMAGIEHDFESVRVGERVAMTRPSSDRHYRLEVSGETLTIIRRSPDLIYTMIELHKGHGPALFKVFLKVVAPALMLILLSGLYLGLTSPVLRSKTMAVSGAGVLITLGLAFM